MSHAENAEEMRALLAAMPPLKQQQAQRIRAELVQLISEGGEVTIVVMALVIAEIMTVEDSITLEDGGFSL